VGDHEKPNVEKDLILLFNSVTTNLGAPGLAFETWESAALNKPNIAKDLLSHRIAT
jgi:hypothetical protein